MTVKTSPVPGCREGQEKSSTTDLTGSRLAVAALGMGGGGGEEAQGSGHAAGSVGPPGGTGAAPAARLGAFPDKRPPTPPRLSTLSCEPALY